MIDRLPYKLSKGVTATIDGIFLDDGVRVTKDGLAEDDSVKNGIYESIFSFVDGVSTAYLKPMIGWDEARVLLRYREGEPWASTETSSRSIVSGIHRWGFMDSYAMLHRLAAILCDDAEAFRVLHWCVENLGVSK